MVQRLQVDGASLQDYLKTLGASAPGHEGLLAVISAIARGAVHIQRELQRAALGDALGAEGSRNVHGELVQKLDKLSADTFRDELSASGRCRVIGCEEFEDFVFLEPKSRQAFDVFMDPLDGSSNIDVAVGVGSIFGIWPTVPGAPKERLLRPGREQIAAVYAVYGSSTILVVATKHGVDGFTLDTKSGVFHLTHKDIKVPAKNQYYSVNEGNAHLWSDKTKGVVDGLRQRYSSRYIGSLVADVHRNLLKGGVFLYPGDSKSPEGKLRLMYEANPLGFVVQQAGGFATTGEAAILDVQPTSLHQRIPLVLVSCEEQFDGLKK
ncbi:MAG: fructose-1,6-bisphosphatase [Dehalococcoidia bacterium]|nr:fructose-1,6-bisphosphatase [Dehalococcoidia bacterium]